MDFDRTELAMVMDPRNKQHNPEKKYRIGINIKVAETATAIEIAETAIAIGIKTDAGHKTEDCDEPS